MPTLAWKYIGPDIVPPDEAALFSVTLGQTVSYYDSGPGDRTIDGGDHGDGYPGFAPADGGYGALDMELWCPEVLEDSVTVIAGGTPCLAKGIYFWEFAKGTHEILVEVRRGLTQYQHPPIALGWRTRCGGVRDSGLIGEGHFGWQAADPATGLPFYSIGMKNKERAINWLEACPRPTWSGPLAQGTSFFIRAGDSDIDVMVVSGAGAHPLCNGAFMQTRPETRSGVESAWESTPMSTPGMGLFQSKMNVALLPDGLYQVRTALDCTGKGRPAGERYSSPSTVPRLVMVDRKLPFLLKARTSSGSDVYGAGDLITLTFSEPVICEGYLDDGKTKANAVVEVQFGDTMLKTDVADNYLRFVCDGSNMALSLLDPDLATAATGKTMAVSVSGVYDAAGNMLVKTKGVSLARGNAADVRLGQKVKLEHHDKEMEQSISEAKTFARLIKEHMGEAQTHTASPSPTTKHKAAECDKYVGKNDDYMECLKKQGLWTRLLRQRRAEAAGGSTTNGDGGVPFDNTLFGENQRSRQEMAAFQKEAHDDVHSVKALLKLLVRNASGSQADDDQSTDVNGGDGRERRASENVLPTGNTLFDKAATKRREMKGHRESIHAQWHTVKEVVQQLAARVVPKFSTATPAAAPGAATAASPSTVAAPPTAVSPSTAVAPPLSTAAAAVFQSTAGVVAVPPMAPAAARTPVIGRTVESTPAASADATTMPNAAAADVTKVVNSVVYDEVSVVETYIKSQALIITFKVDDCDSMNRTEMSAAKAAIMEQVVLITPLNASDIDSVLLECITTDTSKRRADAADGAKQLRSSMMLSNTTHGAALNNSVVALNEAIESNGLVVAFIVNGTTYRVAVTDLAVMEVKYSTRVVTRLVPRTTTATATTKIILTKTDDGDLQGHTDKELDDAIVASIAVVGGVVLVCLVFVPWAGATKINATNPQKKVHPETRNPRRVSVQGADLEITPSAWSTRPRKTSGASKAVATSTLGGLSPLGGSNNVYEDTIGTVEAFVEASDDEFKFALMGASRARSVGGKRMPLPNAMPKSSGRARRMVLANNTSV